MEHLCDSYFYEISVSDEPVEIDHFFYISHGIIVGLSDTRGENVKLIQAILI
jgi:hypothetical protein